MYKIKNDPSHSKAGDLFRLAQPVTFITLEGYRGRKLQSAISAPEGTLVRVTGRLGDLIIIEVAFLAGYPGLAIVDKTMIYPKCENGNHE